MPAKSETGQSAIHNVARKSPGLALLAAVIEHAVTDARGGDKEALTWIKSPECFQLLATIAPDDTDPYALHAYLVERLEGTD